MFSFVRVLGTVLSELAKGTPPWKLTLPAFIHAPKSALDMVVELLLTNLECLRAFNQIEATVDAQERLSLFLKAINNVFQIFTVEKPFNPVLGEFIEAVVKDEIDGTVYRLKIEQISHHPPAYSFELSSDKFKFHAPTGVQAGELKIGFNYVDIPFTDPWEFTTIGNEYKIVYQSPNFRVSPLLGARHGGPSGPFEIVDTKSGLSLEGSIYKSYQIKANLMDINGKIIDEINGDLKTGVYSSNGDLFSIACKYEQPNVVIPDQALNDPYYSANVWGKVYEQMTLNPPNWRKADEEKRRVEEYQRSIRPSRVFKSRYGFKCEIKK